MITSPSSGPTAVSLQELRTRRGELSAVTDMPAPAVEMLWEGVDPESALRDRFGFGGRSDAGDWVTGMLEEHWGARVGACERIVISGGNALAYVTTAAGRHVAKWSVVPERFHRLSALARLTDWLDGRGIPVSAPVPAQDGRLQIELDGVSMSLQRVISGTHLDVEDSGQVHEAGAVLARLHQALAAYPHAEQLLGAPAQSASLAEIVAFSFDVRAERIGAARLDALHTLICDLPHDDPPCQLVHGDYRAANILCDGSRVKAVIDFEEARLDHCVVEATRSAVMLGTLFRDWGPVSSTVRALFRSGYESVRPLTPVEAAWWDVLTLRATLALVPKDDDPTGWGTSAQNQLDALLTATGPESAATTIDGERQAAPEHQHG